jgi:hypothetical protein
MPCRNQHVIALSIGAKRYYSVDPSFHQKTLASIVLDLICVMNQPLKLRA